MRDRASQVCHSTPNQTESVKNLSSGHNANRGLTSGFYPHVEIKPNRKKKGGGEGKERGRATEEQAEGSLKLACRYVSRWVPQPPIFDTFQSNKIKRSAVECGRRFEIGRAVSPR